MVSSFLRAPAWRSIVALLGVCLGLLGATLALPATVVGADGGPSISSDKADYAPGETVTLTGTGWQADEEVRIVVNDTIGQTWKRDVTVAAVEGAIVDVFSLPTWFVSNYDVTATGTSGVATTTFTDLSIGTYDQCSNDLGVGYTSGDTGCRWINGNLQSNNSIYFEGDATVQRLWLTDFVPGSSHTVTLKYGTTKGGKHAYDFLTTWDWSEDWVALADRCQDIAGCETAGETTYQIPPDTNVPDSFEPNVPGERLFVMRGGTLTSTSAPAIVSGSYGGDSETVITVSFTVASTGPMCVTKGQSTTCGVALWFGAHVAAQANWGIGQGAGSISGSPYHVALDKVDGASVGQRDNQMQANAIAVIPNGTIVIVKDAIPDDAQDFSFNLSNDSTITTDFKLDDDPVGTPDATWPNSQTFPVPPGTWTASELNIPAGWFLQKLVCVDPTNNTTVNLGAGTATIVLAWNETVTCTFTDTPQATEVLLTTKATETAPDSGSWNDVATLTGGDGIHPITGNVAFSLCGPTATATDCTTGGSDQGTDAVEGGSASTNAAFTPTQPGYYCYRAEFTSTSTFYGNVTHTDAVDECFLLAGKDLTVSKTVTPAFDRTYSWDVEKAVDQTKFEIPQGGTATAKYTIDVTRSQTDSNYTVTGSIKVTNPNPFDVQGVDITDAIATTDCVVTGGADVTVPANNFVEVSYTCDLDDILPADGTNVATATWDKAAYFTPTTSATGQKAFSFAGVVPTKFNTSVWVNDPNAPASANLPVEVFDTTKIQYSKDFSGTPGTCTKYDNTATIYADEELEDSIDSDKETIEVCVGVDLTVTKTATPAFDRTYSWDVEKAVDQTKFEIPQGGTATAKYTIDVTRTEKDSNFRVTGSIKVTNPNDWQDITVDITDAIGATECLVTGGEDVLVEAGQTVEVSYSCKLNGTTDGTNIATADWGGDEAAVTPTTSATGQKAFSFAGVVPTKFNTSVWVNDPNAPASANLPVEVFDTTKIQYSKDFSGTPGTCTKYDNTATIYADEELEDSIDSDKETIEVCVGVDLTVTKTATPAFDRTYSWDVEKAVDQTEFEIPQGGTATAKYTIDVTRTEKDSNFRVTGSIKVTNPNDWQDITVDITDAIGATECLVTGGEDVLVEAGQTVEVSYSCKLNGTTDGTNIATWGGDEAAVTPTTSATGQKAFSFAGVVPTKFNTSVLVNDPNAPASANLPVEVFDTTKIQYSKDFSGTPGTCTKYDNTATIYADEELEDSIDSDKETIEVCVGVDLTVTKTATPAFDRTYSWDVEKAVDQTEFEIPQGGTATAKYTIDVTRTEKDSNFRVTGSIKVTNPNDWQDITVDITDAIGATECLVTGGEDVLVEAGQTVEVSYSCKLNGTTDGTNIATADWGGDEAAVTPTTSATGQKAFSFAGVVPTKFNTSVWVNDPNAPASANLPVEVFDTTKIQYSKDFSGTPGTCTKYDNTATIYADEELEDSIDSDKETIEVCVGVDLTVTKTADASFHREYLWDIKKNVDKSHVEIADGDTATFHYVVDVDQTGVKDTGWRIQGKITVSNPNDWEAITADVTDSVDIGGGANCAIKLGGVAVNPANILVPADGTVDLQYACRFTGQPSLKGLNTAIVTWDADAAHTPNAKTTDDADVVFQITGTTNKTIHVTDSYAGALGTVTATDEEPFASDSFKYERKESGVGGECTTYPNTATIFETDQSASQKVKVCVGLDLTVKKTADASFTRTYKWNITKDVNKTRVEIADGGEATFHYTVNVTHNDGIDSDWVVKGEITVTNPNKWEAITADITDAIDNGGDCVVTGGDDLVIPADGSKTVSYKCTYDSKPNPAAGTNTATATWDNDQYATPKGSASGTANVNFGVDPKIVDGSVKVTDTIDGNVHDLGEVSYKDPSPTTFEYDRTFKGDKAGTCTGHDNTATFATNTNGLTESASQTVKVCVGKDLTVSKTAATKFNRKFNWDISKDVDKTVVRKSGGNATFNYTVTVKHDGGTDGGWKVFGTITVSNPNDWEDVVVDVTDAVDNAGDICTVTDGTNVNVPSGGSVELKYVCKYDSAPDPEKGTNTATAKWDEAKYATPTGKASGIADFDFGDATKNLIDECVKVTDSFAGVLGNVCVGDGNPTSFRYSRTVPIPSSNCKTYDNTATFTTNDNGATGSASQTVKVCGPAKTGALTIGYWQNKNGQGIIKNGSSTAGVCNSATWLRQFNPFKDLSSSASCQAVAAYATTIIKAADASGASMNAMLKAQMLATALDVYFSTPSLGGNKIGAPAPIGGVEIDIANASSAFGGATHLTVNQILDYASSQSNSGGTAWYGQVKATQELAKNTFDDINNERALAF